jgi:hypothetical protein
MMESVLCHVHGIWAGSFGFWKIRKMRGGNEYYVALRFNLLWVKY